MDVMREPGSGIGREVAHGERADAELDAFITRRSEAESRRKDEGERAIEETWRESERAHNARQRAEMRAEWCEYHRGQAERHRRNLAALVAHHEAEAEKLMEPDERRTA